MDNPQMKESFVAFIDVLGFSEMITKDNGTGEYLNIIKEAIHNGTEMLFSRKKETNNPYAFWFNEFKVKSFSDCFCFSIPLQFENGEKNYNQNFISFYIWLKVFYNTLLSKGFLCRGGISQGWHYADDNIIFSKALIDAYLIESKKASHPIIMIDDGLLIQLKERNFVGEPYYHYLFAHDNAGRNFLHPFNYSVVDELYFGFRNGIPNQKDVDERNELINMYLRILDEKIIANTGKNAADKYQWLKEFSLFTLNGDYADKFFTGLL
jgi:hypothetical protein